MVEAPSVVDNSSTFNKQDLVPSCEHDPRVAEIEPNDMGAKQTEIETKSSESFAAREKKHTESAAKKRAAGGVAYEELHQ